MQARLAELATCHGVISTPVFLPVGSQGTVKAITPDELKNIGVTIVLSNAYHLYLRPGIDTIAALGGLHKYMAWDAPILTDSGGYQIFSLAALRRVNDDGVFFRSHIDGSEHFLTPESVIELQERLGADIIMPLDECPAYGEDMTKIRSSVARTRRWARKCQAHHRNHEQLLFGIVQGGIFPQLRRESALELTSFDFPGYAIGGLSIGEPKEVTWAMVEETIAVLPSNKPRYMMGMGSPEDILEGVARGVDIFDSALPTRLARNGALFTTRGRINIQKAVYKAEDAAIDAHCDCYTCRTFSAAYLHHLFKCKELLAYNLATIHNLRFITRLVQRIRHAIQVDAFAEFKSEFLSEYRITDEQARLAQKRKWLAAAKYL